MIRLHENIAKKPQHFFVEGKLVSVDLWLLETHGILSVYNDKTIFLMILFSYIEVEGTACSYIT